MTASQKVLDLRRKGGKRWLFENFFKLGSVFALAHCDAVRVLLPAGADVVAVAKKAFVAVDEFRHGVPRVIAPPRFRVGWLLRLLSGSLKIKSRRQNQNENERDQLELSLHWIYSEDAESISPLQILKSEGRALQGRIGTRRRNPVSCLIYAVSLK